MNNAFLLVEESECSIIDEIRRAVRNQLRNLLSATACFERVNEELPLSLHIGERVNHLDVDQSGV